MTDTKETTMTTNTTPTFYTEIRDNRETQNLPEVFRMAERLGYPLVKFDGWSDADIGSTARPGTRRDEVLANRERLQEIVRNVGVGPDGYPNITIFQTKDR